ncbi:2-hydroxychromene-2-carboxylate isomerase [Ramlibacter humi]|uniref:2-hydroxychromene-2-carboxylate isomerase n=1 Tax=Ramlibacter humi TaxID=2530451 RepID=A0A4Z0BIG9_9BURK|nr:2-hydroxychromene-2-carboxylate isomerase [Ramlibacter humi]TFY99112.1 2-hydroxychromene-2-carboxylate isomerase [Ramlibacter humi]
MKHIDFHLDFISPYAYLAFEQLPRALEGLSYEVAYRPILFAALLKHHGQLGPAEIPGKREWTYRQVLWQAQAAGLPMQMPSAHPFNPLGLLRLATACGPNRYVCETLFRHAWRGGEDAADPARLQALQQQLAPRRDPASQEVKDELKAATGQAIAQGVFGVPTFAVDGKLFWGVDSLPMLRAYLEGHEWFGAPWDEAAKAPAAVSRVRAG